MRIALWLVFAALAVRADNAEQEQAWRAQIFTALHLPGTLPALAAVTHGRFEPEPGVVAERISYSTLYGMRVPAVLYLPQKPSGKIPAIIVVNGHGGDKFSWYAYYSGILYARAGAAVLTYDPLGEGERNPQKKSGTRAHDNLAKIPEVGPLMGGQMITDVRQAVSYLAQRPEIDGRRIAAAGYSLGSFVVALTGAVETRLRACVMVGGGNLDGVNGYWDRSKPLCQGWPYQALQVLGDRPAVIYALHASRGSTLVYNGTADVTVSIPSMGEPFFRELRRRTIELRGSAENVFEYALEPEIQHRPFFVTRPVALWLERQLDFPNWSESYIQAMPQTHIGDWAKAGGEHLDPLYATEPREGGAPALGVNVPVLSRTQLSVFSAEDWELNQSKLTVEHWEKEIHRQLGR